MDFGRMAERADVGRARRIIHETDGATLDDMVEVVQIPAPTFGEAERGAWVAERFEAIGLADVTTDEAGNVLARLPGPAEDAPVLLSAHLDTVFPEETDLTVRREDGRVYAPGIGDNARGLAGMLAVARGLVDAGIETRRPVVFVATVGEEGLGDLRGVKHLFRDGSPWRDTAAFISLDGAGRRRIVNGAIGSRRFRIRITGPGGHSWADWGRANPAHALAAAVAELARDRLPAEPRTTFSVGRIGGGTSVNAIPTEAWCEIDLRSEDGEELARRAARVEACVKEAVAAANDARRSSSERLTADIETIGDRPGGTTPDDSALVRAAWDATRQTGSHPELAASSTDANLPISLGIPAVALGAGGRSRGTHTTEEWYANDGGPEGIERALLTVLGLAGVG